MHIAIIGSRGYPYIYSGYETFVKEISERLVKNNIEVTVYCHRNLFKNRPKRLNGIKLIYLPTIEIKILSQFIHSFQSMVFACFRNYDAILIVNSANGPFGYFSKLFKKKTAINVDGLEWLRPKWKGLGSKYFFWSSKVSTRVFDIVITDSIEMNKIYQNIFNCDSKVIAYGANIRFSKNPEFINEFGLVKENYYLIVGRLIPDNNANIIIREYLKSKSSKKLVVVGDVPYKDKYAEKIFSIKHKRVIFTGYIRNQDILAELYHNCYAYIHGHEFGGTNPTLLKALAYGAPIIALDTVFNREVLLNDKHGIFFTKNIGDLKSILEKNEKNSDKLLNLKNTSRERIIKNYTWEKITQQYIDLFHDLTKNN